MATTRKASTPTTVAQAAVTSRRPAGKSTTPPTARRATRTTTGKSEVADAPVAANAAVTHIDKRVQSLARDLRSWADFVLGVTKSAAGAAADLSFTVVRARLPKPAQKAALDEARSLFRELRDAAGLTLADLGQAINLKDTSLLEAVEGGKVGLPFEVILRLAAVLGRNDPIPIVMKLTRAYNPKLWTTLEGLGVGKLAVHAGREREIVNLYRSDDRARQLSDEEFAKVLGLMRAAFELAMAFRDGAPSKPTPAA